MTDCKEAQCFTEADNSSLIIPNFFLTDAPTQLVLNLVNLNLSVVVIFVSLRVERTDLCRLYTLWLYSAYAPNSFIQSLISYLQLRGLVDSSGIFDSRSPNLLLMFGKFVDGVGSQVYRVLSFLMVFLTFVSYTFPFLYQKYCTPRTKFLVFLVGYITIIVTAVLGNTMMLFQIESCTWMHVLSGIVYYLVQFFNFAVVVLMFTFYFLSMYAILIYARKKTRMGQSNVIQKRQITAVLVYCTAPNLISIPIFFANTCFVYMSTFEVTNNDPIIGIVAINNKIVYFSNLIRLPVITISTFVAFAPYRRFVKKPSTYTAKVFLMANASSASNTERNVSH
ncbi:hypothetical protein L596_015142 [Steinernema carpocapsae]|uniref:G-protein coupled receptors family 1 profile domain-containing protein n=1 Tax=Steinernema carpocapsae TaxID=34508 RepID=A0A4U5NE30_STECR|nr:hypothetical protein L596_015142 [Steinernema carpocapsae]